MEILLAQAEALGLRHKLRLFASDNVSISTNNFRISIENVRLEVQMSENVQCSIWAIWENGPVARLADTLSAIAPGPSACHALS